MTDTPETWKPVVGYEGFYEVSDRGRVRAIARKAVSVRGQRLNHPARMRKINYAHPRGYASTALSIGGIAKTHLVHRLVAFAFLGEPAEGQEVNHKNGDKRDNSAANLEWVTHRENTDHAKAMGLLNPAKGAKAGKTKLTPRQVRKIRELLATERKSDIARRFGVSHRAITSIQTGRTWRHLS